MARRVPAATGGIYDFVPNGRLDKLRKGAGGIRRPVPLRLARGTVTEVGASAGGVGQLLTALL